MYNSWQASLKRNEKNIEKQKKARRQRAMVVLPVEYVGQTSPELGSKVRWPKQQKLSVSQLNENHIALKNVT